MEHQWKDLGNATCGGEVWAFFCFSFFPLEKWWNGWGERPATWMSMEVSNWLVWDLQPTYIGVIIHLLSTMDLPVVKHGMGFLRFVFFLGSDSGMKVGAFTLPKTNSSPLKMVVSKFGISKFPGGPHFQGPTVSLGGEEDLHERTYYGS